MMFFLKWLTTCVKKTFMQTLRTIVLAGFDDRTIYKYFRMRGAQIGEGCRIFTKSIGTPDLVRLGNHVWISFDVVFHHHDGGTWVFRDKYPNLDILGAIIIEDNCMIGRGVQLLPNIRIGRNSIVGAGSVVISDIPPNSIVMGVPARPIGSLVKYEARCLSKWKEQTPPGMDLTEKNWWLSKKKYRRFKEHLINLYLNHEDEIKENAD
jgi:acetyltransferase-like isoleucine patch superfamily enzyme